MQVDLSSRIYGCLLGGLIGDAMGAPIEGKPYSDIEAHYGVVSELPLGDGRQYSEDAAK